MRNDLGRRLKRLEVQEQGQGRLIIVVWPGGDVEQALEAHAVEERHEDLVISINRPVTANGGWVLVDGVRQERCAR